MDIGKLILKNLPKFDSWYDVADFCYDYLRLVIDDQALFIGEYVLANERAENKNPNLEILKDFEAYSNKVIHNHVVDVGCGIKEILGKLSDAVQEMIPYGDPILNEAALVYFLLTAIDRYSAYARDKRHAPAPLNREYKGDSYIYFASPKSLLHDSAIALRFRDIITDSSIKNCLSNLHILETRDCLGSEAPNVISLSFDIQEECPSLLHTPQNFELKNTVLKVALIPFWGQKITNFKWTNGANFVITYSEEYLDFAAKRAITLLETAIDQKVNIIVFPEFVCAPSVQQKIGEYLADLYERNPLRLKELMLVMAGSGWTQDNNNVMAIYDRTGMKIGQYYKYSKFWEENSIEGLSEPGKECTIIDVAGVGRILPSICRDVSNEDYTKRLIDSFKPFLLCTSAFSSSVNGGFKNQYDSISKRYQVTSMLCNCCEALCLEDEGAVKKKVNLIATPFKDGSIGSTQFFDLERNGTCHKDCSKHQCMFIIDADFSKEKVQNKQIVLPKSYHICL